MVSLPRREQFVSTLVWISHIHLIRAQSAYWLLNFVSLCRKRKNGHCLSQCESIRLWSSQTTSFTSLLVERPASKTREMRLLLCPSSCWKRGREFKKSSIAIRIRCGLTSRGQTVSIRITRLSNFCRYAYVYFFFSVALRPNACDVSRGNRITHNDATQSVGLLWTSDQLVAEASPWQNTTLTTEKHAFP